MKRLRVCAEPGCSALTSESRCAEHTAQADETYRAIYYTKRWQSLRKRVLKENWMCEVCGIHLATQVDHIIPMEQGGPEYDRDNLQGLCNRCHGIKTARERQQVR